MTIPSPTSSRTVPVRPDRELTMANDWLRLALEAGKSVGWDWDIKSGRDSWFGDLQTMFGIPATTYFGHVEDFRRRVHAEDRVQVWKGVQDAMQNHKPYTAEFRMVRPDGSLRWVSAKGTFSYSANGEPERMMGIAVDITERKVIEQRLHQKEFELKEAQRVAGVGSWQWNSETDTVTWSDELYRLAGRDPRLPAISYEEHSKLYTPESWARLSQAVAQALETGGSYEVELEMIQPDGSRRWLIGRGEPQFDENGRISGLHGTVQDITERRQAREAVRESEERLRLAAKAGRMYAFEWDRASDIIMRSAECKHILGLGSEPKETTCQEMLVMVHRDDRAKVSAATRACTPENPNCRIEYRVLRSDGSVVWMEKNAHAFFDGNGNMVRMVGMVGDITARKLAEEALSTVSRRLIEAQENERARIARDLHDDIGQRIAVLSFTLEHVKLLAADSSQEIRNRLNELRTQLLGISSAVHNMSHELHSASLRHIHVTKAMRGLCMELSDQHNVEINFAYKNVPETVRPEISLCLFRVLQEALHNAMKHSGARQFDVEVFGTTGTIELAVRDSGCGFAVETPMNRSGLGLWSMEERLKLVQGKLSVDSQPGKGTTIHARVPFSLDEPS
jgi:PAS domain S-box-containing protein